MGLAQNEEVIQALAPDGADHPLHEGVLPGRAGGGEDLADPHALDSPRERLAVDRVSITEQEPGSRIVRECLDDLPGGPDGRGVVRDVDMEEFAAVVAEHDEDGQEAEGQGRHEEEVHGDDLPGMRGQKDFLWFTSSDFFLTLLPQLLPRHRRQVVLLVIGDLTFPQDEDDLQPLRA